MAITLDESFVQDEAENTASSLKEKQASMESMVYRIWTHLSAFEESSAACISDMLRNVSNGLYLEAIRMAEKFILHVEVLFAAIDELEGGFAKAGVKGGLSTCGTAEACTLSQPPQECLTCGKRACYVAKPWTSSLSCRTRKTRQETRNAWE